MRSPAATGSAASQGAERSWGPENGRPQARVEVFICLGPAKLQLEPWNEAQDSESESEWPVTKAWKAFSRPQMPLLRAPQPSNEPLRCPRGHEQSFPKDFEQA